MAVAVLDTTVLYGAADTSDEWHESGLAIVRGVDDGSLPDGVITDFVLAETLNGMVRNLSHKAAVDYLDRIEANDRFEIVRLTADAFATGKAIFRRHRQLSLVDGLIVGHMRNRDSSHLYSFDSGFDEVDGITRLATADNPFTP